MTREEEIRKEIEELEIKLDKYDRDMTLSHQLEIGYQGVMDRGKALAIREEWRGFNVTKEEIHLRELKAELKGITDTKQDVLGQVEEKLDGDKIYPIDIFPEIPKEQWEVINKLSIKYFGFPLDRISADIGRKLLRGLKQSLTNKSEVAFEGIENQKVFSEEIKEC